MYSHKRCTYRAPVRYVTKTGSVVILNYIYICILFMNCYFYLLITLALQPSAGYGLLISQCFLITHNDAPHSVGLSGRVISSSQRPLTETHTTNIHAPCEIRTNDHSRRAAVDLGHRPSGHWDRHIYSYLKCIVYDKFLKPRQSFRVTLYSMVSIN
jgi:hypothetical protein